MKLRCSFRLSGSAAFVRWRVNRAALSVAALLCCFALAQSAKAQQQQPPEDPEDEKQIGLWLDQGVSTDLTRDKSLEVEFHERFNQGISNFFEYFGQAGIAFRVRPWLTVIPSYRYQRFPGNPRTNYENRLLLNFTLSRAWGRWRPGLRTLIEGRFPENRNPSARFRFRPGVDYTLPLSTVWRPALTLSNEFFLVPGTNSYAAGGSFTQSRFQVGVRLPITGVLSVRPYYMLQSVNLPEGWDTNGIIGMSLSWKARKKN